VDLPVTTEAEALLRSGSDGGGGGHSAAVASAEATIAEDPDVAVVADLLTGLRQRAATSLHSAQGALGRLEAMLSSAEPENKADRGEARVAAARALDEAEDALIHAVEVQVNDTPVHLRYLRKVDAEIFDSACITYPLP
jgi:hypothetical protein